MGVARVQRQCIKVSVVGQGKWLETKLITGVSELEYPLQDMGHTGKAKPSECHPGCAEGYFITHTCWPESQANSLGLYLLFMELSYRKPHGMGRVRQFYKCSKETESLRTWKTGVLISREYNTRQGIWWHRDKEVNCGSQTLLRF
jgi:hypothetical protein